MLLFIPAILLIAFGSLTTFTGCGAKQTTSGQQETGSGKMPAANKQAAAAEEVTIQALTRTPQTHLGKKIRVDGEIYKIEILGEAFLGASAYVFISPPDGVSAEVLKCEFAHGNPPPSTLKEKQRVMIFGKVDAAEGMILLRECSIIN